MNISLVYEVDLGFWRRLFGKAVSGFGDWRAVFGESLGFSVSGFGRLGLGAWSSVSPSVMHGVFIRLGRGLCGSIGRSVSQKHSQFRASLAA